MGHGDGSGRKSGRDDGEPPPPSSRPFFDPVARPTARQVARAETEARERRERADRIASELRARVEARERREREGGGGAPAPPRPRSFFDPRERPTPRQAAEMEAERRAAAAKAAAAAEAKGKKRVLDDDETDADGKKKPAAAAAAPSLSLRPGPPKRTAVMVSPRLASARPLAAAAIAAPPPFAPRGQKATAREPTSTADLHRMLQQRKQQAATRGGASAEQQRKRPTANTGRGVPFAASAASGQGAATASAVGGPSSPFVSISATADAEAQQSAANDLLAIEVMDGRLWFSACADDGEGGDGKKRDETANEDDGAPRPPQQKQTNLKPVPASFPTPRAYIDAFLPLVLEEARQDLRSSWVEALGAGRSWRVSVDAVDGEIEDDDDGRPPATAPPDDEEEGEKKKSAKSPFFAKNTPPFRPSSKQSSVDAPMFFPSPSSASPLPPPAVEVRLRFLPGSRPPFGALRDGDVAVVTRGLPPSVSPSRQRWQRGGKRKEGRRGSAVEPLDWAAGGRRAAAAAGVELEEGELAADAAAAAAASAGGAKDERAPTPATATEDEGEGEEEEGEQRLPLPPPPPRKAPPPACPVAGIVRCSGGVVTLTTRRCCPRHLGNRRRRSRDDDAGDDGEGDSASFPPCSSALRSLASAAASSSKGKNKKQKKNAAGGEGKETENEESEEEEEDFYLTVVGNLVTHSREIAALFAMPAMPLARALMSPSEAAAAARAAVGGGGGSGRDNDDNAPSSSNNNRRWPAEASSPAFVDKLRQNYDHAQLAAIEVAACHLSAGGGGSGRAARPSARDERENERPPFTLVQGPPGTGKTHTVVGILNVWHLVAYQRHFAATVEAAARDVEGGGAGDGGGFPAGLSVSTAAAATAKAPSRKPRLLVCAPSNAAADELLSRVMDRGFFDGRGEVYRPDVVRVYSSDVSSSSTAAPSASASRQPRAREVWSEAAAVSYLDMAPAERAARLQEARTRGSRERRRAAAARAALRLSGSPSTEAASSSSAHAAAVELAQAADAAERADAEVERLEFADAFSRSAGGGNGFGTEDFSRPGGVGAAAGRERKRAVEWLEASLVSRAEMVFTTLSSTGRRVFSSSSSNSSGSSASSCPPHPPTTFDAVLVDEAAQATEPAALQALRFGVASAVLVGDPRQLPATVLSGAAARAGLSRSLFERLADGDVERGGRRRATSGVPVSLLRVQYRMHREIRLFPSRAFYGGALEDDELRVSRLPPEPWYSHPLLKPYVFFDVARGREARGVASARRGHSSLSTPSLRNDAEAALAAALVAELRREVEEGARRAAFAAGAAAGLSGDGPPPPRTLYPTVGVITPYRAQAAALRSALELAGGGPGGRDWATSVETVDGFQGKQVDVAIVSCVRTRGGGGGGGGGASDDADVAAALSAALASTHYSSSSSSPSTVGFVDDVRRLNVAVTRARRALWVLGCGEALRKGSAAWAALLADASRRGVVVRDADASSLFPGWCAMMQEKERERERRRREAQQQQRQRQQWRGGGGVGGGF